LIPKLPANLKKVNLEKTLEKDFKNMSILDDSEEDEEIDKTVKKHLPKKGKK